MWSKIPIFKRKNTRINHGIVDGAHILNSLGIWRDAHADQPKAWDEKLLPNTPVFSNESSPARRPHSVVEPVFSRAVIRAREVILDPSNDVLATVISAWELAIKRSIGRLNLPGDIEKAVGASGYRHHRSIGNKGHP